MARNRETDQKVIEIIQVRSNNGLDKGGDRGGNGK